MNFLIVKSISVPEAKREFTGVFIPKIIWIDKEFSWMEKLFLAEINALDGKDRCFVFNAYFAMCWNVEESDVFTILVSNKLF